MAKFNKKKLPSRHTSLGADRAPHRSFYYAMGETEKDVAKPFVGVVSTWNEAAPCNIALMRQAQSVKKGVRANGGTPREFCTITVTDGIATYALTFIGDVEGTGRLSMADNGTQLMILVPGGKGYIYNHVADTFAQITDSDFTANGAPQFVVFIDGYFLVTTDSKKFIVSAINNGLSYNALDFGTAESDPDDIVAPVVYKNQLFISGGETFEAFQNIGGADFPFSRTGLFLQKGCYSPFSLVNAQDTFMWVGGGENEGPAIWALNGNSTVKISTTAIDLQRCHEEEASKCFECLAFGTLFIR